MTETVGATNVAHLEAPGSILPRGARFGAYVIEGCIGQGSMASVYRAEHALLGKSVALKIMASALLDSGDARQRFLREAQAAAAIKHANVVDITDVGTWGQQPYLVMELLEGEDLETHLGKRGRLTSDELTALAVPIASALGAAHDRGVVHRDLKPSNIFLALGSDGELSPKVLDFGISKMATRLRSADFASTPFDQLMGSPLYLPPEAVRGSRDLTSLSDQYSFAVILYECLTGRPPFHGACLLEVLNAISTGQFPAPSQLVPDVPMALEHVILKAMSPDPAQRFKHVRDMGGALVEVASVRTQMLWGRAFGKSLPPEGRIQLRTASTRVLEPSRERLRSRRLALVGVPVLAALCWMGAALTSRTSLETARTEAVQMPLAAAIPVAPEPLPPPPEAPPEPAPVPARAGEGHEPRPAATDPSASPGRKKRAATGGRDREQNTRQDVATASERINSRNVDARDSLPAVRARVRDALTAPAEPLPLERTPRAPEREQFGVNESPIFD